MNLHLQILTFCFVASVGSVAPSSTDSRNALTEKRTKHLNPQTDLSLRIAVPSHQPDGDDSTRGPWLSLEIKNVVDTPFYYLMEARRHGMRILVTDSDGKPAPLTKEGQALAEFKELGESPRVGAIYNNVPNTIDIAVGDYCKLQSGKQYSIAIEWTVVVYDANPTENNRHAPNAKKIALFSPAFKLTIPKAGGSTSQSKTKKRH
jgi:hypothetical protein